jgi:uncharacterized protein YbaR (Trm112 family)
MIDPYLLERLVCPQTGSPLMYDGSKDELVSLLGRCAYPVRDGLPVMLAEQARALTEQELEMWHQNHQAAR